MIKKIILRNFQIHKKFVFEFSKYFNIVKGPNERGKSSIIRAVYWTCYNSPSGDWMRREENGKLLTASVKIIFKNGNVIQRTKGNDINRYIVNGEEYNNFGFNVPEPAQDVLKINRLKIGNLQLHPHIAMQNDALFLVFETPSVKASVLNMLTGAELLQNGIKEFNKDRLGCSKEIKSLTGTIDILKEDLGSLDYLDELNNKIQKIESANKKLKQYKEQYKKLEDIQNDIAKYEQWSKVKVPDMSKIEELCEMLEELKNQRTGLKNIKEKIFQAEFYIKQYGDIVIRDNELMKELIAKSKICPTCGRPL